MSAQAVQLLSLFAAFWTAVLLFDRAEVTRGHVRFVLGLGLGAVFAHLGWVLMHLPAVQRHPGSILDPSAGFSVLFVPLGLVVLAPWPQAFATLPLAFAVARLGCLASGCCHGPAGEPTPLYEIGGLVALHAVVAQLPTRWTTPAVLAGFGLIRLAFEPLRATPPLGDPLIPASATAATWVAVAALWSGGQWTQRFLRAGALRFGRTAPSISLSVFESPRRLLRRN